MVKRGYNKRTERGVEENEETHTNSETIFQTNHLHSSSKQSLSNKKRKLTRETRREKHTEHPINNFRNVNLDYYIIDTLSLREKVSQTIKNLTSTK